MDKLSPAQESFYGIFLFCNRSKCKLEIIDNVFVSGRIATCVYHATRGTIETTYTYTGDFPLHIKYM